VFRRQLSGRPAAGHPDQVVGGIMLVREVTELRRHERLLLYKDATIREIHHRVKNNLQTVASLLRLQSRRLQIEEAKEALDESVRRISSIALVHETLSQESRQRVSFDKVARRLVDMLGAGLTDPERPIEIGLDGDAGELPAEIATPLALVLSELVQNSLEHAFMESDAGRVDVLLTRGGGPTPAQPACLYLASFVARLRHLRGGPHNPYNRNNPYNRHNPYNTDDRYNRKIRKNRQNR
jgi:two-component sensor histidine kinase